ncbi:MAG TPA: glycosyltransferase family 4 protein [Planctomycetota bacterium]|nr:glycosyltransferase family 4 protein [Planctomycetota bacterium]
MIRLGVFATHPVQYHVPIWRLLSRRKDMDVRVYYFSDENVRGTRNAEFNTDLKWDVDLLQGYSHEFLSRDADISNPRSVRLDDAETILKRSGFTWILIHGYTHTFERQLVRAARRLKISVLMLGEFADLGRRRSLLKRSIRDLYLKWFYGHVTAFCCIGEEARSHLERFGIPPHRLFRAPYSVDTALFERQVIAFKREECRRELGISNDQIVLLFSGKLIPRKAPLLIVDAVRKLRSSQRLVLAVIGDGPLRESLAAAATPVLGERFRPFGFVNQSAIGKYMAAADAFILPSECETWGLVVNEAMQFGLPAIVSRNVGCRRDLIVEGKTGYSFNSGASDELAGILEQILAQPQLLRQMGESAREHIKAFTSEASAEGVAAALGMKAASLA